jgi:hypothetical protein
MSASDLFKIFEEELQDIQKNEHSNRKFRERWANDEEFRQRHLQSQIAYYKRKKAFDEQRHYLFLKLIERFGNDELKEIVKELELLDELRIPTGY